MRIFERLVYNKEISVPINSHITLDQHAYRQGQSTTTALLKYQHHWLKWLDNCAYCVRVYSFDFSKAFDSVSNRIVCEKLTSTDASPYIVNWVVSFLSNRQQRVVGDGVYTEFHNINRGVPEGSVLGPVLFSVMINDIKPLNPGRNILEKFADDLTWGVPQEVNAPDSSAEEIENVNQWAIENEMKLNYGKTWEMVVRGKTKEVLPKQLGKVS